METLNGGIGGDGETGEGCDQKMVSLQRFEMEVPGMGSKRAFALLSL